MQRYGVLFQIYCQTLQAYGVPAGKGGFGTLDLAGKILDRTFHIDFAGRVADQCYVAFDLHETIGDFCLQGGGQVRAEPGQWQLLELVADVAIAIGQGQGAVNGDFCLLVGGKIQGQLTIAG